MKILLIFIMIATCFSIFGADTTETFELGFSDFEYYTGVSNLKSDDKVYSHEITIGAGITNKLSSTFSIGVEKDGEVIANSYSFGLFSTIFDSKYFDFDLYTNIDNSYSFTLGTELNFDIKDNLALAGIYLRSELIYLNEISDYTIVIGSYYTLKELQFLLEFDMTIPENEDFNIAALVFGINYGIVNNIELITDFSLDIPQNDEEINYSFSIGFISTI